MFWLGLFLGVSILILGVDYKDTKNRLKKSKKENKPVSKIMAEEDIDFAEEEKRKLLSELGLYNFVYNTSIQRLTNIFRVVGIILIIFISIVICYFYLINV